MDQVDVVVAGAGVVGLAVSRALALAGQQVLLLEASADFGSGISSRNSEVIHAGIYYNRDSLKAQYCVRGKNLLYSYLNEREIPYRKCGKYIVATSEAQIEKLESIMKRALQAGVDDLTWISAKELNVAEPNVRAVLALWSPSTGIIDSHSYMQSLLGDLENNGGILVTSTPIIRVIANHTTGFKVYTGGAEPHVVECRRFVNCAGLGAQKLASSIIGLDSSHVPPLYYSRGAYFVLNKTKVFNHLIYPVPEPGGLGVHVTLDLGGQIKFGPDVEWINDESYELDESRAAAFYDAIRKYYPALAEGDLLPGYTGIRPKIVPPGAPDADFIISGSRNHHIAGLVNLFGIESPGLTASLAIAEGVSSILLNE